MESRAHAIWIVCVVFPFITATFLCLRFYAKGFITKSLAFHDWFALAVLVPIITYSVLIAQATYNGMGQHMKDFTPAQEERYYFWILVASEFYALSLMGFKFALLLLYLALFGINRTFRWTCYAVMFYVFGFAFSNMITEVAGCTPVQGFWDKKIPGEKCINSIAADIAYGFGYMSSDLMIAILPLPMVWKLKLSSRKEKIGLMLVLSSGFIAFAVSTARWIVSTVDLVSTDRTWIAGAAFLLSIVEVNTGLICSCTPALKPLFITARRASLEWTERRASRKRSFETDNSKNVTDSSIRRSMEKPLPQLPELGASMVGGRFAVSHISQFGKSGAIGGDEPMIDDHDHALVHEMEVDRHARHELGPDVFADENEDVEAQMDLDGKHDAYDGQNDITRTSESS